MGRFALFVPLAALALAGCGEGATEGDALEAANEAALATPAANATAGDAAAILSTSGIALADGPDLSFGASRPLVMEAMADAGLGDPQLSNNAECGAGPMEFAAFGGLTLNFQDGQLVGWMARDGAGVTTDGIRPGASFADLARERSAAMVEDSTLGGEFSYRAADGSDIYGFVDEAGDIDSLYAGTTCFFR